MNQSLDYPIEIVSYCPEWPFQFEQEAERLASALNLSRDDILHIGSTSVPDLASKALIDFLIVCSRLEPRERYEKKMTVLGYSFRPVAEPDRLFYEKKDDVRCHVHLVQADSWHYWRLLLFRDRLRRDPHTASNYVQLKKRLAENFRGDRDSYSHAKTAFVTGVVQEELEVRPALKEKLKGSLAEV